MTYRVHGTAHGDTFDERGFTTLDEATDYASDVIDGDLDGTIEVEHDETGCDRCGADVDWANAPVLVDGEARFLCAQCFTRWLEWRDAR